MLKESIKGIIDTFTNSLEPSKIEKLLQMTQKLTRDVETMKTDNESSIGYLKLCLEEIKASLRNLVDISKEAMHSNAEGLKKIIAIIADHKARPLSNKPPLEIKQKNKLQESNVQGMCSQTMTGPYTRIGLGFHFMDGPTSPPPLKLDLFREASHYPLVSIFLSLTWLWFPNKTKKAKLHMACQDWGFFRYIHEWSVKYGYFGFLFRPGLSFNGQFCDNLTLIKW